MKMAPAPVWQVPKDIVEASAVRRERAAIVTRLRELAAAEERAANAPATPGGIALHLYAESVLTEIADELERTSTSGDGAEPPG